MKARDDRLTRIYEKHNRAVRAYCVRRLGSDEASDAVADVFAVAWRRIDDVPSDEAVLPWLYGVARRVVSDHYRSRRRRRGLLDKLSGVRADPPVQPDWQVVQRLEYDQVHAALGDLRDRDREVLLLAAWEELSNAEIAQVIGVSTQAAAQRIHRAKQRLGRKYRAISQTGPPPPVAEEGEQA